MRPSDVLVIILLGLLFVLFAPIILLYLIYAYIRSLIDEWRFKRYLRANEGATFFAYTNKASSKRYVEENILPHLPIDTKVIHLAGKKGRVHMGGDLGLLAYVVSSMRETDGGFPYASKIVNGVLVTQSMNDRLYSAIRRGLDAEQINYRILRFYST